MTKKIVFCFLIGSTGICAPKGGELQRVGAATEKALITMLISTLGTKSRQSVMHKYRCMSCFVGQDTTAGTL